MLFRSIDQGPGLPKWKPENYTQKFYGPAPMRIGIEQSRNLMTVRLAQEIGMDTVVDYAERFGVYDNMNPFLANALGSEETTLFRVVAAYAMFANGGERVEPTLVDRVQDRYGRTVYRHDQRTCVDCGQVSLISPDQGPMIMTNRERIMNAVTAYQLTSMMQGVVQRGTASRTVNLPVPTAGKTGTTNENTDAWFIGFTPAFTAGVWVGNDDHRISLGEKEAGSLAALPIWVKVMEAAHEGLPVEDFPNVE